MVVGLSSCVLVAQAALPDLVLCHVFRGDEAGLYPDLLAGTGAGVEASGTSGDSISHMDKVALDCACRCCLSLSCDSRAVWTKRGGDYPAGWVARVTDDACQRGRPQGLGHVAATTTAAASIYDMVNCCSACLMCCRVKCGIQRRTEKQASHVGALVVCVAASPPPPLPCKASISLTEIQQCRACRSTASGAAYAGITTVAATSLSVLHRARCTRPRPPSPTMPATATASQARRSPRLQLELRPRYQQRRATARTRVPRRLRAQRAAMMAAQQQEMAARSRRRTSSSSESAQWTGKHAQSQ